MGDFEDYEITYGTTGTLGYQMAETILMPRDVDIDEGVIVWKVEYDEIGMPWHFTARPVSGCLREFASLADASPEQVLDFTRRRGVLAIRPTVAAENPDPYWAFSTAHYREPVEVYTAFARNVRYYLAVADFLQTGRKITADEMYYSGREIIHEAGRPKSIMHRSLTCAVSEWGRQSSSKLILHVSDVDLRHPFEIAFGDWEDGHRWDSDAVGKLHPASLDPPTLGDETLWWGGTRPSPLFNVLSFQLLQHIALPDNTYFCAGCGRKYKYDAEEAKITGASRPRRDRDILFCSDDCRDRHKKESDRQRYRDKVANVKPRGEKDGEA